MLPRKEIHFSLKASCVLQELAKLLHQLLTVSGPFKARFLVALGLGLSVSHGMNPSGPNQRVNTSGQDFHFEFTSHYPSKSP